ncbi:lactate dehydrogenase/glycoside hydrolase [Penicillium capsulatum]|uniref:Lactate dehydrogenase/glycoside hydrolase n=1 Tax=Penicillium capsulatum TaxID=69766 RepID=A0A9W9I1D7_9EURO|nr:lactate dehydrogenase/glycoside hydrolase [Penicillium capsulatum]KAJ6109001.1 lactate dehydrogenase/glycoside hydrolase [Penicillium capsulatum]
MASQATPISRIAIIGAGQVGTIAAHSLIISSVVTELLIVDVNRDLRDSQVFGLRDVSYCCNSQTQVRVATHQEARESEIVVITAGSKYHYRGETSVEYIYQKASIIRSIIGEMKPFKSDTILLVVANPVDLLTCLAYELSGLPASQVIGSGTFLDSLRVQNLLAQEIEIAPPSIGLYIVGVHGDPVIAWSGITIDGVPMNELFRTNTVEYEKLTQEGIKGLQMMPWFKGSTPLGIGSAISSICSSIMRDQRNIRSICFFQPEWGTCFSMPAVLGRAGIVKRADLPLDSTEKMALEKSAKELKATLEKMSDG